MGNTDERLRWVSLFRAIAGGREPLVY